MSTKPQVEEWSPVVTSGDIVKSLQVAEVAVRASFDAFQHAIEKAVGVEQIQQAAVWDARLAHLRHAAHMLGLTAIDVRLVLQ